MKHSTFIVLAIVLGVFTASPAWAYILKGPYIQVVTRDATTIVWESENNVDGLLEWGETDTLGEAVTARAGFMHEITLTGLKPNTAYYYRVTSDGETTPTYEFKTAPTPDIPFRYVAYGDSRSGYSEHRRITQALVSENPDIYSNSGDLVCTGNDAYCWQEHFNIERDLMAERWLLPAIGNHDVDGLDSTNYKKFFTLPPNGLDTYEESFYYADWGNTRFITLDSETAGLNIGSTQYDWLIDTLESAKADPYILHIFINVHEGPYSAKPGRSGNSALRAIDGLMANYGVTAVISGHDHYYYRGTSPNGLEFIVTGGGGAGLYPCEPRAEYGVANHECLQIYNYVVFDIDGPVITAVAKDIDGRVIETFTWQSSKEEVPYQPEDGDESDGDIPSVDGDDVQEDGDTATDGDTSASDGDEPAADGDAPVQIDGDEDTQKPARPEVYDPGEVGFATGCTNTGDANAAWSALFALLGLALLFARRRAHTHGLSK